jgi:hypothetical protein
MKRQVLLIVALMLVAAGAVAQIPANVMDVLNKCDEKMSDPKGIILDMTLKTKILIMSVTKITHGCSDSWFKLDMNRYKNAVVVRK